MSLKNCYRFPVKSLIELEYTTRPPPQKEQLSDCFQSPTLGPFALASRRGCALRGETFPERESSWSRPNPGMQSLGALVEKLGVQSFGLGGLGFWDLGVGV